MIEMKVVWLSDFEESFQNSGVLGITHVQFSKPGADPSCRSGTTRTLSTSETLRLVSAAPAFKNLYTG